MVLPSGDHLGLSPSAMAIHSASGINPALRNDAMKIRERGGSVALNKTQRSSGEKRGFHRAYFEWLNKPVLRLETRSMTDIRSGEGAKQSSLFPSDDQPSPPQ